MAPLCETRPQRHTHTHTYKSAHTQGPSCALCCLTQRLCRYQMSSDWQAGCRLVNPLRDHLSSRVSSSASEALPLPLVSVLTFILWHVLLLFSPLLLYSLKSSKQSWANHFSVWLRPVMGLWSVLGFWSVLGLSGLCWVSGLWWVSGLCWV